MSRRTDQVASTLKQTVQTVLSRGLHDPRVRGLITVTKVEVEPDLVSAKVWVSVFPRERQELTMHGLRSAARHIRRDIGEHFAGRRVPELHFEADLATQRQSDVLRAIAKAREELDAKADPGDPADPAPDAGAEGDPA